MYHSNHYRNIIYNMNDQSTDSSDAIRTVPGAPTPKPAAASWREDEFLAQNPRRCYPFRENSNPRLGPNATPLLITSPARTAPAFHLNS